MSEPARNMFKNILIVVFGLIAIGFLWSWWSSSQKQIAPCTLEAKLCPDGSSVGRVGPLCEFAPCPGAEATSSAGSGMHGSGIKGTVLLGPTCPVERIPPDPACADKPYVTTLEVTAADGSRSIKEFSSDASGTFTVEVPSGEYVIRSASTNFYPRCSSGTIRVVAGAYAKTTVYCDTGIR